MIQRLILALSLTLVSLPAWGATTRTMTACSSAAFDTAYADAVSGDTIAFPAGSCSISSWPAKTISKTNITIQGRGVGTTIINTTLTSDGCFNTEGSGGNGLRITGIDFRGPGGSNGFVFQAKPSGTQRPENIRLDNNRFYNFGVVTQWGYSENTSYPGAYNCLIDNNNFDLPTYSTNYLWGDCDSTTLFPFTLGTVDGVVFEDNIIHAEDAGMVHFITGRCGLRATIRYNSFYLYAWDALDMHDSYEGGGRANAKRGSWTMEVYHNKFYYEGRNSGARTINFRGGQSVLWSNYYDGAGDSNGGITLQSYNEAEGVCTASQCDNQTPCSDGRYCDHVNRTYIWGNKYNCASDMTNCASGSNITSISTDGYVTINTDYWMSAMSGYSALAYPHPLRSESTPTLTIPSGVIVGGGVTIR